jgi:hypothetical protein
VNFKDPVETLLNFEHPAFQEHGAHFLILYYPAFQVSPPWAPRGARRPWGSPAFARGAEVRVKRVTPPAHDHMLVRVDLVGSHGRWKRPCRQTAHMTICY